MGEHVPFAQVGFIRIIVASIHAMAVLLGLLVFLVLFIQNPAPWEDFQLPSLLAATSVVWGSISRKQHRTLALDVWQADLPMRQH
tara:strand:+ start:81 stop:335 length:255 start_codon:yes stop_codon:yes gene_type:complete